MNKNPDDDEPELFEESYIKEQKSTPWILIAFLLFAIVTAFWKKFVTPVLLADKVVVEEEK